MEKIDLIKMFKSYYSAKTTAEKVNFGKIPYLAISGKGDPGGTEFSEKVQAIYPVAYGVKKICKDTIQDFGVPKLEGLWWSGEERPGSDFSPAKWFWKLLIRMPDFVTEQIVGRAVADALGRKKETAAQVSFEIINEDDQASILHVGPYNTEGDSITLLDDFIHANGLLKSGPHHEIYLSDPNKTDPGKLRTILRQPVKSK